MFYYLIIDHLIHTFHVRTSHELFYPAQKHNNKHIKHGAIFGRLISS